jgi:nucleotide-binding universal stress UspA family protein
MSGPIIIGLALREDDAAPLALGRTLAHLTDAPLVLATAYPPASVYPIASPEYAKALIADARAALERVAAPLRAYHDVSVAVAPGTRAGALHAIAERLGAGAIVVGSSHHGAIGRVLAGDVAANLLHGSPCPVLVAPRGYAARTVKRIGVAFQDTPEGRAALDVAAGLAAVTGASLRIVTAVAPEVSTSGAMVPGWTMGSTELRDMLVEVAQRAADGALHRLDPGVAATAEVRHGPIVGELADVSHEVDLLVTGSRGYGALRRVVAGSVSRGLAHQSAAPLLVVPAPAPAGSEARKERTEALPIIL